MIYLAIAVVLALLLSAYKTKRDKDREDTEIYKAEFDRWARDFERRVAIKKTLNRE